MKNKEITRSNTIILLVEEDGKIKEYDRDYIFKKNSVDSVIKLWPNDFKQIKNHIYFTHFNLQYSRHKKGHKYALVKITKPGFFSGKKERMPVITFKDAPIFECIKSREYVKYKDLKAKDFENSLKNIQDVKQLQKAILRRYKNSMKHLTDKEKLSLGVGITYLKRM